MVVDRFGRPIRSLRVSVTQRCNLNCIYCHREGESNTEEEIELEDLLKFLKLVKEYKIRKMKISGGEPLLRKDLLEFIAESSGVFKEVSMTTNGTLLEDFAQDLKDCGLSRVNVSLDTLRNEIYKKITGKDMLDKVLKGIEEAVDNDLNPVKINMVVMSLNKDEIEDLAEFSSKNSTILQLIELLKTDGNQKFFEENYLSLSEIEEVLKKKAEKVYTRQLHNRRKYIVNGAEIEVVRPMDNSEFCMHCTRIRITSDGKIKPCLLRKDNLVDIKNKSIEEMREAFIRAVMLREPYFK
ncbi:MAG: GTP 3',8-cyclase MoaA [Candidatus Hydrothermarchaeota archaeon]